jgi:sodium-coupled monocarboxylate transporter 8/12
MSALYSGLTMLGTPAYAYMHGPVMLPAALAILGIVPITVAAIPVLHRHKLTTAYEYLELRFSRPLRLAGSGLFCVRISLYLGGALYAPAVAVETLVGAPMWLTIGSTGLVSTVYTVKGGMRAVIWTDIMQFFVLTGALLLVTAAATWAGAGVTGSYRVNAAAHHMRVADFSFDPTAQYSFFVLTVGGVFAGLIQTISDQIAVQRIMTARTIEDAQQAYWMKFAIVPLSVWLAVGGEVIKC